MQTPVKAAYTNGRRILERLPQGCELTAAVLDICRREGVQTASFSVTGNLSEMTVGTFDQRQQVYVTQREKGPYDILSCTGTVTGTKENPSLNARLTVAGLDGAVTGGALFAETIIYAAELDLQELSGPALTRTYDPKTGLQQWVRPLLEKPV